MLKTLKNDNINLTERNKYIPNDQELYRVFVNCFPNFAFDFKLSNTNTDLSGQAANTDPV